MSLGRQSLRSDGSVSLALQSQEIEKEYQDQDGGGTKSDQCYRKGSTVSRPELLNTLRNSARKKTPKSSINILLMEICINNFFNVLTAIADSYYTLGLGKCICTSAEQPKMGPNNRQNGKHRKGIRQSISPHQLFWLVTVLSIPQFIIQICGVAIPSARCARIIDLNDEGTFGRYECARPVDNDIPKSQGPATR